MRVISGTARGHKLIAPEGLETRPTTDRIKESLFNMIAPKLYDCSFLDLFCGSGSIGIEALSRGAKEAVFVDNGKKAIEAIEENLSHTKLGENAVLLKTDAITAIKAVADKNMCFDIIFLDPPYADKLYEPVLKEIVSNNILKKDGFIIAEHSSKDVLPTIKKLKTLKIKDYKTTIMSFLTLED